MKRAPVTAVLADRLSMLRPEMNPNRRSCGADQNNGQPINRQQKGSRPPRPARNNTAMMGEGRIDAPASSRPMLREQKSPITVPNVPEMNMQMQ
jgi:hypothetical protein